ncbi:MAG: hypothetical protein JNM33_08575 [Rubrivivax sp.]|nr:hypothetical protein [Rubrivivax sp.]
MPTLYTVTYQLGSAFQGNSTSIVNVAPATVSVSPSLPREPQPPYVAADPANGATAIKVVGSQAFNIVVLDAVGSTNTLYPVGIAVQNPAVRQRPTAVFPSATVQPTTPPSLQLSDEAGNDATGTSYEFVLLFQDSFGFIGTLDPRIINDEI